MVDIVTGGDPILAPKSKKSSLSFVPHSSESESEASSDSDDELELELLDHILLDSSLTGAPKTCSIKLEEPSLATKLIPALAKFVMRASDASVWPCRISSMSFSTS